jgi:hypothetical protein
MRGAESEARNTGVGSRESGVGQERGGDFLNRRQQRERRGGEEWGWEFEQEATADGSGYGCLFITTVRRTALCLR